MCCPAQVCRGQPAQVTYGETPPHSRLQLLEPAAWGACATKDAPHFSRPAVDENRRSALHFAAAMAKPELVTRLLKSGAEVDLADKEGERVAASRQQMAAAAAAAAAAAEAEAAARRQLQQQREGGWPPSGCLDWWGKLLAGLRICGGNLSSLICAHRVVPGARAPRCCLHLAPPGPQDTRCCT